MDGVINHFWVAGGPLCSTSLLVAPGIGEPREADGSDRLNLATAAMTAVSLELFDVDGTQINEARVEFPSTQVGIVELEPFSVGLKYQAGLQHGRVRVVSPYSSRVACRYDIAGCPAIIGEPKQLRPRESSCIPLSLGAGREHLIVVLNVGTEDAHVVTRLFYGARSPEWSITVPAGGSRVIGLEHDLLAGVDDKELSGGISQGYLRFGARQHSYVTCKVIERVVGERGAEESCKMLTSW